MGMYPDLIAELQKKDLTEKQFSAVKRELSLKYKEKTISIFKFCGYFYMLYPASCSIAFQTGQEGDFT